MMLRLRGNKHESTIEMERGLGEEEEGGIERRKSVRVTFDRFKFYQDTNGSFNLSKMKSKGKYGRQGEKGLSYARQSEGVIVNH